MKTNYTDTQLQAAIDVACNKINEEHKNVGGLLILDPEDKCSKKEKPARLDLIKAALAALPEPPMVDGKTPGQVAWDAGNEVQKRKFPNEPVMSWEEGYELHEQLEAAASAVLAAFGKQSQSQPQLSQLRPLAEAGPVPEGCVRVTGYKSQHSKTGWVVTDFTYHGVTHFADIMLPEAKAPAVEAEKPDPYAELKKAHADEPTPEPMSTKPISLPPTEGISLRDYFAGQALQQFVAERDHSMWAHERFFEARKDIATAAYNIADAMLKAREVKP